METLLGSYLPLHQKAWHRLKGWYRAAVDRAPSPDPATLKRIMAERVDLYRYVPPLGANIPIYVEPLPVEDSVPTEDEIEWVVKRLQNYCSRRPSGMRDEHIKGWLMAARKKEKDKAAENPT